MNPKDLFFYSQNLADIMKKLDPINDPLLKMQSQLSQLDQFGATQKLLSNSMESWLRDSSKFSDMAKQMQPILDQHALGKTAFDEVAQSLPESLSGRFTADQELMRNALDMEKSLEAIKNLDFVRDVHSLAESTLGTFQSFQEVFSDNRLLKIERSFSVLLDRFSDLYSLSDSAIKLPEVPTELIGFPPLELFNSSRLIHQLHVGPAKEGGDDSQAPSEEPQHPEDSFAILLAYVNPAFVSLWEGAKQSLNSTNPDRARHTVTSLRELFTHLLHHLAPDDHVTKWTQDPNYYHNNRPTRRARLQYICRSINVEPFRIFLDRDVKLLLEFFDLFQKGTHELASQMGTNELNLFKIKTESAIRFLIEIKRLNSNN